MAKREIKTIFALDGETKYTAAIKDINKAQKLLSQETKILAEGYRASGDEQKALTAESEAYAKQIALQQQKLDELKNALEQSVKLNGEDAIKTRELSLEVAKAEQKLATLENQLKKTNEQISQQTGALNKAAESLQDFGSKAQSAGEKLESVGDKMTDKITKPAAAGGAALLALGVSAVKATDDMTAALNDYLSATGKSADESERYEKVLTDIYKGGYGENFGDIANAMALINQQMGDMPDDKLQSTAKNAILLRDTFDIDINEGIRGANALMKQFGLTADEAYELMAQGAQRGLNQNQDLADQLAEYSVYYADMGYSAQEMFSIIESGTQNGVFQVDKLNDAVKEFGIKTKDSSDSTKDAFSQLNLNADELTDKFAKGGESAKTAFKQVTDALFSIKDETKQNTVGVALFGTAWEDLGTDAVKALSQANGSLDLTANKLGEIAEMQNADLGSLFKNMGREIQVELMPAAKEIYPILEDIVDESLPDIKRLLPEVVTIVKDTAPAVRDVAGAALELLKRFSELDPKTQKFILQSAATVAALGPVVKVTGELTKGLGSASQGIGTFIGWLAKKKAAETAATAATQAVTSTIGGAGGLLSVLGPTGIAIGGVTAALGLAALAFYESQKGAREYQESLQRVEEKTHELTDSFSNAKVLMTDASWLTMSPEQQAEIDEGTKAIQDNITSITTNALNERRALTEEEFNRLQELIEQLRDFSDQSVEAYEKSISVLSRQIANDKEMTQEEMENYLVSLYEYKEQIEAIYTEQYDEEYGKAVEFWDMAAELRLQGYEAEAAEAEAQAQRLEAQAEECYSNEMDKLNEQIIEKTDLIYQGYTKEDELAKENLTRIAEINEELKALDEQRSADIQAIGEQRGISERERIAESEEINNEYNAKIAELEREKQSLWNESTEDFTAMLRSMMNKIGEYDGILPPEMFRLASNMADELGVFEDEAYDIGENAMRSLKNTMEWNKGSLIQTAGGIASGVIKKMEQEFGINSPSKEAKRIAGNVTGTLADTMRSKGRDAVLAAQSMSSDILAELERLQYPQKLRMQMDYTAREAVRAREMYALLEQREKAQLKSEFVIPIYVDGKLVKTQRMSTSQELEQERLARGRALGVIVRKEE